jgi:hypothetical protein
MSFSVFGVEWRIEHVSSSSQLLRQNVYRYRPWSEGVSALVL